MRENYSLRKELWDQSPDHYFPSFSADVGPWKRSEDPPAVPVWSGCPGSYCVDLFRAGSHVKS